MSAISSATVEVEIYNTFARILGPVPVDPLMKACRYKNAKVADEARRARGERTTKEEVAYWINLLDSATAKRSHDLNGTNYGDRDRLKMTPEEAAATKRFLGKPNWEVEKIIRKRANNWVYLFDSKTREFPIGLLPVIESTLDKAGLALERIDKKRMVATSFSHWGFLPEWMPGGSEFDDRRWYFEECAEAKKVHPIGFINWATGAGKTYDIAKTICQKQCKTLVIVPSIGLMKQLARMLRQYTSIPPEDIGFFYGQLKELKPITIGVINSVCDHIDKVVDYGFDMTITDEAHHAGAQSYFRALGKLDSYYRYGYSGTAFRKKLIIPGKLVPKGQDMILAAVYSQVIHVVTNRQLIHAGILSEMTINFTEYDEEDFDKALPFHVIMKTGVVKNMNRNNLIIERTLYHVKQGRTALILVNDKQHGRILEAMFKYTDYPAIFRSSDNTEEEREEALVGFTNRDFSILIGTQIYMEGVDIPTLDTIVFAGGLGKSHLATFQKLGRGLRLGKTTDYQKKEAFLEDIFDQHHALLKDHSLERMRAMKQAGFHVPILLKIEEEEEKAEKARLQADEDEQDEALQWHKRELIKKERLGDEYKGPLGKTGKDAFGQDLKKDNEYVEE